MSFNSFLRKSVSRVNFLESKCEVCEPIPVLTVSIHQTVFTVHRHKIIDLLDVAPNHENPCLLPIFGESSIREVETVSHVPMELHRKR
jgi:hypothetical protein